MKKKAIVSLLVASMILTTACVAAGSVSSTGNESKIETGVTTESNASIEIPDTESSISTESSVSTETPVASVSTETSASVSKAEETAEDDWYAKVLNASVKYKGNNYRVKRVLEKARSGETVNMAILGGSITEGAGATSNDKGYAYQFAESFKKTYCSKDNLNYINAGISGTPSALGVMRYQRDVVDALGAVPDLLVIEFAVNDWQEATGGRAYESLIYRALSDNEDCAVILLFSSSMGKWNLQNELSPYGIYYKVPSVSIVNALTSTKNIKDDDFFFDEYHPKTYGHTVMSDCLMNLLDTLDKADADSPFEIPEKAKKGRQFANMTLITSKSTDVKISKGDFTATDSQVQAVYKKGSSFPNNFMKKGDSNKPFKLTVTCQTLLLDYKTANDSSFGVAEVYVDGVLVTTLDGYSSGGWNNNNVALIIDEAESGKHVVEVKMAKGSESKSFTILSLAYE